MDDSKSNKDDSIVQSDGAVLNETEQNKAKENNEKHGRKRKRLFYGMIRRQMEFYLGDANLSKDRFINKLLATSEYIPLDTFLKFNKIKELTTSVEEIQKALETSKLLELSLDRQCVRRTTDVKKREDVDEFTVYVEALPPKATHETITNQFKQFGNVVYVSLPKYRRTGRIKEFAFVEFEDKESIDRCLNAFRQFNGVIADTYDADKLKSVQSYIKEQEEVEEVGESGSSSELSRDVADDKKASGMGTKRQAEEEGSASDGSDAGVPPVKQPKLEGASDSEEESAEPKTTDCDGDDDDTDAHPYVPSPKKSKKAENSSAKKRRRRKAKAAKAEQNGGEKSNVQENDKPVSTTIDTLRIATKSEWKRLRNKYLTMQREKFAEAKKILKTQNRLAHKEKQSTLPPFVRPVTMKTKPTPSTAQANKRICTRNINFYGAMHVRDEDEKEDENDADEDTESNAYEGGMKRGKGKDDIPNKFSFDTGIIVRVNFEEPCVDVADFKAEMKQYDIVKYIDLKEGDSHAMIRVDKSQSAPQLIKHCAPNRCQILTGAKETEYWEKIAKDRAEKRSKSVKVPRTRAKKTSNVLKKIVEINVVKNSDKASTSHIRFNDDDE